VQTPGLSFAETSLVDTEFDGQSIRYYARANRFLGIRRCSNPAVFAPLDTLAGMYVGAGQINSGHPEHSIMLVKQVDAKSDRIEILLTATEESGDDAYGKIKLMLGSGYQSQSLEQLEMNLAQVIELPRIGELVQARNSYDSIENQISALEVSLSSELTARQKVVNATKLLALYDQEPGAVARLNRVAFSPIQAPESSAKIEKTATALTGFQQQADKEKIDAALNQYAAATAQMKADCERLPSNEVKTRAELDAQVSAVDIARQDLNNFESARTAVISLSRSVPDSNEEYSAKCSSACELLSQTFSFKEETVRAAAVIEAEAARQQQEKEAQLEQERIRVGQLERVDEDYRNLKKRKAALNAKLLTMLGGPDEYAIYSVYRNLLGEMIQNRQQAIGLGSRSAEQEMQTLIVQLQKLEQ